MIFYIISFVILLFIPVLYLTIKIVHFFVKIKKENKQKANINVVNDNLYNTTTIKIKNDLMEELEQGKILEHIVTNDSDLYNSNNTLAYYKKFIEKKENLELIETIDAEVNNLLWTI